MNCLNIFGSLRQRCIVAERWKGLICSRWRTVTVLLLFPHIRIFKCCYRDGAGTDKWVNLTIKSRSNQENLCYLLYL